jgi:uncharacterized protein (UPF0548 family)
VKVLWRPHVASLTPLIPRYAGVPVSYREVGASRDDRLPPGYHHLSRSMALGTSQATFDRAAEGLGAWAMHRRAGLVVAASAARAEVGITVVMALRLGARLGGLVIPCRVVWTLDEPDRYGFAHGTLPDHPERGEEAFLVEQAKGLVTLKIRAFSKPGNGLVQAASGAGRLAQKWMTVRYAASPSLHAGDAGSPAQFRRGVSVAGRRRGRRCPRRGGRPSGGWNQGVRSLSLSMVICQPPSCTL